MAKNRLGEGRLSFIGIAEPEPDAEPGPGSDPGVGPQSGAEAAPPGAGTPHREDPQSPAAQTAETASTAAGTAAGTAAAASALKMASRTGAPEGSPEGDTGRTTNRTGADRTGTDSSGTDSAGGNRGDAGTAAETGDTDTDETADLRKRRGGKAAPGTDPRTAPGPAPGANPSPGPASKPASKPAAKARAKGRDKAPPPIPEVIEIAPVAKPARMRPRHWWLALMFLLAVALPLAATGLYLWTRAQDQYASFVGFTVRKEDSATGLVPTDITGLLGGSAGSSDTDVLYEFIQSASLVARIDREMDLRAIYSAPYGIDPVFALAPGASIEDLGDYWQRVVRLSYDQSTGLMELRVLAFDAVTAQQIARRIVDESQRLINDLNATARADTLRYAEEDLAEAEQRLRDARESLVLFRTRTQIVDPETDAAGQTSLINVLQQQLAQALIDYDLLRQSTSASDPRVVQAESRIAAIRSRIAEERETSVVGEDYPRLLADYESLAVDREFAEESYRAARAALDQARANASRQTRYLAAYVPPTLPQTAEYPRRLVLLGLAALFLALAWAILSLVYYAIRDTR